MDKSHNARVRVAVLGPVLVEDRAGVLGEPAGVLGKSLIVALTLAHGGALAVHSLVHDLWNDNPPRQERAALQTLVSRVRAVTAEGILESTASGYALGIDRRETDLGLASRLAEQASAALDHNDLVESEAYATEALALWRDEPAIDLGETPLAAELVSRASALWIGLHVVRARARLASGNADAAADDLTTVAAAAPLDESVALLQMRAAEETGRRNDAVQIFARFRARLREALGTNPGREILRYHAELLRKDAGTTEADALEPDPAGQNRARRHHRQIGLRSAPNELLGRADDVAQIEQLIERARVVTILGPGGIGKTRLAQEIAHRAAQAMPTVIVVELASVRTDEDVALALGSTLGIREVRSARPQVAEPGSGVSLRTRILSSLAETDTLLVIDNAEHIVDAAAAWVSDIIASTSSVRVLVTSRAPLSITAERIYQLDSLSSTPDTGDATGEPGPAVNLFLERARAARPRAVLPLDVVARLCDRLDGLPLAIELAAARIRSMSVDEIEQRLTDRFALLQGGDRTAPERHRTLLAVIEWSWNLLGPAEQSLLMHLSRFPDGFSAAAAQFVSGPAVAQVPPPQSQPGAAASTVVDSLDKLVTQSLVSVVEDPATGILRYRMLETVREFGDLALIEAGEVALVGDRMFAWAAWFSRQHLGSLSGSTQIPAMNQISAEQDNLLATLRSAIELGREEVIVAVFATLANYWSLRSAHSEVVAFGKPIMDALARYEPEPFDYEQAAAAYSVIGLTLMSSDVRTASRAISKLKKIRRQGAIVDPRMGAMIELLMRFGRPAEMEQLLKENINSTNADVACMANLLASQFEENTGDAEASIVHSTRAFELALGLDDTWAQASAAQAVAQLHSQLAHPHETLVWAERAQKLLRQLQSTPDLRQLEWIIAVNLIRVDELERSRSILEAFALEDDQSLGFDYLDLRAIGRSGLADIALREGNTEKGLALWREAVATFNQRLTAPIPWLNVIAAGCLIAHVRAGSEDVAYLDGIARALRVRLIVESRVQPSFSDMPVLGSALLGLAAWLLWSPVADGAQTILARSTSRQGLAFELVALGERLNSRQDMPTLTRARLVDDITTAFGFDSLDDARRGVAPLTRPEAAARGIAVLDGWYGVTRR